MFGVGRMGLVHLEHLAKLARNGAIELVAIGDRHPPVLEHARRMLTSLSTRPDSPHSPATGASATGTSVTPTFTTPDAMADECQLDACVVASRTEDHARDTLALASRGVAVLVEKPMAQTLAEAAAFTEQLGALGAQRDRVQIAFQRHYDAAARAATKWVVDGRIGSLQQSHHVLQDKNPTPAAYQSAGITADMAIHLIFEAMSFHAFELPASVQALRFMAPHYDDRANEGANVVHAFLQWTDGSVAHLWGSRINNTGYDNGFKMIGTDGRIDVGEFVGDFGPIHAKLWTGTCGSSRGVLAESLTFDMTTTSADQPDFYARYGAAYGAEIDAFIAVVSAQRPCAPGVDVGWKTMLVAELAERSSLSAGRRFVVRGADDAPIADARQAAEFIAAL